MHNFIKKNHLSSVGFFISCVTCQDIFLCAVFGISCIFGQCLLLKAELMIKAAISLQYGLR